MKTFRRICLHDHTITDEKSGESFTLERGHDYLTSDVNEGVVTVFTRFWIPNCPIDWFAGEVKFT